MKTKCNSCGKFSFRGCGNHLFEIFKNNSEKVGELDLRLQGYFQINL